MKVLLVIMVLVVILALALLGSRQDNFSSCGDMTVVAEGETVSDIAGRCHVPADSILALNPEITDPNHLTTGMVLKLPMVITNPIASSSVTSSDQNSTTPFIPVTGNQQLYPTANPLPGQYSLQPSSSTARSAVQSSSQNGPIISYTIQPGDTLAGIAARYGTTVASILALNPSIEDPNLVYPGDVILVQDP